MKRARSPSADSSLDNVGKRIKEDIVDIDYKRCIICQNHDMKYLYNVQDRTAEKLKLAMHARNDTIADKLSVHVNEETWIEQNKPKWHKKCRGWYINEKNYEATLEKRGKPSKNTQDQEPSTSTRYVTRSTAQAFHPKQQCVICGKQYYKSKKPTCKVTTKTRENTIIEKARSLKQEGESVLRRITGAGHDMVANDICYHKECMDRFKSKRPKKGRSVEQVVYEKAFCRLTEELEEPLFKEHKGYLVRKVRDRFRCILADLGVRYGSSVRSYQLKSKLLKHFGKRITILDESCGSGFICSSDVKLGDALGKLNKLERDSHIDKRQEIVLRAAEIIKDDMEECKKRNKQIRILELSLDAASDMVPDTLFNFSAALISDTPNLQGTSERVQVGVETEKRALLLSQQILQQATGMPTPLSTATAHHLFNSTRSKSLVTLCNRLGQSISYDRLHRQLTAKAVTIMQEEEDTGILIPENISVQNIPHIFAIDNLDWRKKTLDGGTFNATTAIIIQNAGSEGSETDTNVPILPSSSAGHHRSLRNIEETQMEPLYITKKERRQSRSLGAIPSLESLETQYDGLAESLLLLWKVSRVASVSPTQLDVAPTDGMIPGFSAFCGELFPNHDASKVGYFPLIPDTPTNPAVLHEAMKRAVKTSQALGNEWTVITGDQATYELARAIREKNKGDLFNKVILLIGGFHQAHNFLRCICKIMRESGAEDIIAGAGLCKEGTARKIFGEKADYYQTLHVIKILSEALWRLFFTAFEEWSVQQDSMQWVHDISELIQSVIDNKLDVTQQSGDIRKFSMDLTERLNTFQDTLKDNPMAKYWLTFLEMCDILLRSLFYQREGDWLGHLSETANMLPFLAAAGHYKYGQQSLPQYLTEMKHLSVAAPDVYHSFMNGNFVARRANGSHNAVSPDMLLEQTYNAEAKEVSGLNAITMNESARSKWIYTKPVTAAASFQLKSMLDLNAETQNPHHESGKTRTTKDAALVENVMKSIERNPFSTDHTQLINISTGQVADHEVQVHLTTVGEIGKVALENSIEGDQAKTAVVKLKTFHTQNRRAKESSKRQAPTKSKEVIALLRITQITASGGDVDITDFIGNHECADFPPSLFDDNGNMRATGSKSSLVKALEDETEIQLPEDIPESALATSVIIDAMYCIRKWSFEKGVPFPDLANRYRKLLCTDVPSDTKSVHFCCDRYNADSLKSAERNRRTTDGKMYEVSDQFSAPDPKTFFHISDNKASLLNYLCEKWVNDEKRDTQLQTMKLFLAGGFRDVTRTVVLNNGSATPVPELESTQEEADTRLLLHAVYATKIEGVKRIVMHVNDTDVIVLSIYYYKRMLQELGLQEFWVKKQDSYLPIHEIATRLDDDICQALPLLHSISGRDTTSYPYFTGKKVWLKKARAVPIDHLAEFGEVDFKISDDVINQARQLIIAVYSPADEGSLFTNLAELRAHKFLKKKEPHLKVLPPTEDAFLLHLKRAAYATIIDKTAHIPQPDLPELQEYGWTTGGNKPTPLPMNNPAWPSDVSKGISCACKKGCSRNCKCSQVSTPCYIGCLCRGHRDTCSRVRCREELTSEVEDSDSERE